MAVNVLCSRLALPHRELYKYNFENENKKVNQKCNRGIWVWNASRPTFLLGNYFITVDNFLLFDYFYLLLFYYLRIILIFYYLKSRILYSISPIGGGRIGAQ
jgi:hypothetical protein